MKNLVNRQVKEHCLLLALIDTLEVILSPKSGHSFDPTKFRQTLEQVIELMAVHNETERVELSPALQRCLPEVDYWQIKMLEIQDEAISTRPFTSTSG